jgi:hypothetical protein
MRRVMLLAAVAGALLTPALAHGATIGTTIRGTVAVKQANRHMLVLAARHGVVESARVSARQLRHTRVGERLRLVGKRLADGSLHVTSLRRLGSATQARLRVVVLQAKARRLLVAGGGSAFSIRRTNETRGTARPGHEVEAEVELERDGPVGMRLEDHGKAPLIDFSGVVTALGATSFTVTTDGMATVVQLPDGVVLPAIVHVGSEVEVVATIDGSTLTLASIKLDDEQGDDNGVDVDQGRLKVEGFVTALDVAAGSIAVQGGDNASPIIFAIPAGLTLPSGVAAGSAVEVRGAMVDGVLTLTRIELRDDGGGDG